MRPLFSSWIHARRTLVVLATFLLLAQPGNAAAEDLLGLYLGAAFGQSRVEATASEVFTDAGTDTYTEDMDKRHAAFKGMFGVRPISLIGAEVDYIDFGKAYGAFFENRADVSMKGPAAFGVLYLPVPVIDVFLKAGAARLESTVNGDFCGPCACAVCKSPFQVHRTNTSGAGGGGAQYKFGSWAVRAEYERFNAAGGNPSLLSAGVTWTFF